MRPTVEVSDSEIVIRLQTPSTVPVSDRLIRVESSTLDAEGLELAGVKAKIREGALPVARIGRCLYVRLSDLLALPRHGSKSTVVRKAKPTDDFEAAHADELARKRRAR